ncbi:hypothetical protein B6N60_05266 [Richelia sinica FACHB-800]|uniref:Uncharacterized protein n=1 Tax=Richelia sinica FACHB-800 TaxID=1357546 RepID=A0A975Y7P0_9NOST|nr:hypothetical protein B6N60_05266 [Richelia sinica FACHB-800]
MQSKLLTSALGLRLSGQSQTSNPEWITMHYPWLTQSIVELNSALLTIS